jgi:hypothetical protein
MDAVKQWRYEPTLLKSQPVEVDTTISVIYQLHGCYAPEPQAPVNPRPGAAVPSPPPIEENGSQATIEPQLKADILHLFDVMHVKENLAGLARTIFQSMRSTIVASLPPTVNRDRIADAYLEKLLTLLQSPEYMDQTIAAYAKYFSDDDIKALIQFYETPAGQHFTEASPQLMADVVRIGQQFAFGNMERIWKELCQAYPELQGTAKVCPKDSEKKSFLKDPDPRASARRLGGAAER